ncbi:MAG: glycosyltransferase family 2 protein, partial [Ignavibacteriae bacterium]|nr:glycosyltransferase family 2 protein [Ignavibacteriota bacterium]
MENENSKTTENKNVVKSLDSKLDNTNENQQSGNSSNFRKPRRRYPSNRRYPKSPRKTENASESPKSKFPFSRISILVPLFNEEESLAKLTKQISDVFNNIKTDYEILFVDDGSVDNSLKVIKDLARTNNKIRYISFRKNYGKSAALNIGFKNVTGDVVITMDADLQDDPGEIPNLLHELQKGYDLVSGWKKKRHDP